MVTRPGRISLAFGLAAGLMLVAPACSVHGGGLEGVTVPRGRSAQVQGEVRSVDNRRNQLTIREGFGRTHTLRYDNRTRVIDGRRSYSINALGRGAMVRAWISYDRRGTPWVDRLEVRDGGHYGRDDRDRRVVIPRIERLDGTVGRLDSRRAYFTLEWGRNQAVTVRVPARLPRDDARRLDRLRRGDRVRIEARELNRNTFELVRFR
jgi:hypothetical protein